MNTEWIWLNSNEPADDSYAEFKSKFTVNSGAVKLRVSCDSIFAAFIDGEAVLFSQCADYPHHKLYDEKDISLSNGEHEIRIIVWYHGTDTQIYQRGKAGLWYEILDKDAVICNSNEKTLGRVNKNFKEGAKKLITNQLGFSFYYDNTIDNTDEFLPCVAVEKLAPEKRPQNPLYLDGRVEATYTDMGDHILVDLGREVAGYPELDFVSDGEQELLFTYGEHLEIGKVTRLVGGRDFSFEFKARDGENKWFCPLRRIACRYIEVYYKSNIKINYIGVQHVYYPVTEREKRFDDELLQRIYNVGVRTMRLCMHEHYEDCPWREQALYALDSRNQMLFGYKAFYESEYQRSNLLLINEGLQSEGLLAICFPAGRGPAIPFFSLAFILEVAEYAIYTGDRSIIDDTRRTVNTIIETFNKRKSEYGLIPTLPPPFWNFYEWSEGNDGDLSGVYNGTYNNDCDLILNAMYVYVINLYNKVAGTDFDTESIKSAIERELYVPEKGMFKISRGNDKLYGQLGNALAILAGLGDASLAKKVAECDGLTPATLSMKPFVYDALLTVKGEYEDFIISDIKRVWGRMLDCGATSFWETELGWEDFDKAGSLCHAWSAAPVYYLDILGYAK